MGFYALFLVIMRNMAGVLHLWATFSYRTLLAGTSPQVVPHNDHGICQFEIYIICLTRLPSNPKLTVSDSSLNFKGSANFTNAFHNLASELSAKLQSPIGPFSAFRKLGNGNVSCLNVYILFLPLGTCVSENKGVPVSCVFWWAIRDWMCSATLGSVSINQASTPASLWIACRIRYFVHRYALSIGLDLGTPLNNP